MFGLGLKRLEQLCIQLSQMLEAGIPLPRALNSLSNRGVSMATRPVVARIAREIEAGAGFTQAIERQGRVFPPLMRNLIRAGEESGNLEAVLKRLGNHFGLQRQIRNSFLVRLIYPGFQITAAIFILAVLAYFMASMSSEGPSQSPEWAALKVLISGFGTIAGLVAAYYSVTRGLTERRLVQEVVLRIPVLGALRRSMALANFSWSMELMLKAGTNIRDALRRSFESTSNGAFVAQAPIVEQAIIAGATVTKALSDTRLFPDDFMEVVNVAEESGNMDESFGRLARLYYERTEMAMKAASIAFSVIIWVCVAGFIIYNIFKLAMNYFHILQQVGNM